MADSVEPDERAKALGWLSAATNAGVALGPPIGSLALAHFHRTGPGLIAAILCLVNMVFAWRFLSESRDMTEAKQVTRRPGALAEAIRYVLTHTSEPAPRLIWMYAVAMGAFHGMMAILALFLADRFGVGSKDIGIVFAYIGTIAFIVRAGILGRAVDRYGEVALSRVGLVLLAVGLAGFPFVPNYVALAVVLGLIPLGTAFTFPCVTSLLSRVIQSHERGLFMGVQQTFGGLSRVLVPLWAGYAYDHFGHGVPFWTSAILVVGVMFLGLGVEDPRKEQTVAAAPTA